MGSRISHCHQTAVSQEAEFTELFGGAWIRLHIADADADGTSRIAHLGFDGYRDSYTMWEIGRGGPSQGNPGS